MYKIPLCHKPQGGILVGVSFYTIADGRVEIDATEPREPVVICEGTRLEKLSTAAAHLLATYASEVDTAVSLAEAYQVMGNRSIRNYVNEIRGNLPGALADPEQGALWTIWQVGYAAVSSLDLNKVGFEHSNNYVDSLADGLVQLDFDLWVVKVDGKLQRNFTLTEFKILATLASNKDRVMSTMDIARAIWSYPSASRVDAIKMHIANIRKKLGKSLGLKVIQTEAKQGYRGLSTIL